MVLIATRIGYDSIKPYEIDLLRAIARQIEKRLEAQESIKALEEERKRLMEMAFKDPLTGAYTRTFFLEWLKGYQSRLKRIKEKASVIVMDVDCLKKINDSLGHSFGDEVLRKFARTVMSNIRDMDVFVRWGGDEFLLVLPGVGKEDASKVMERIRRICAIPFSSGMAELSSEVPFNNAFEQADKELYKMKSRKFDCEKIINILRDSSNRV
jgi:diguanylate cyclase (GGDEF)-like protein